MENSNVRSQIPAKSTTPTKSTPTKSTPTKSTPTKSINKDINKELYKTLLLEEYIYIKPI